MVPLTIIATSLWGNGNAIIAAISAIIGAVLTWSSTRFNTKKSVESVYLDKITKYMENQDEEIADLTNKLNESNGQLDVRTSELEAATNRTDSATDLANELRDQIVRKDEEINQLRMKLKESEHE